jgi:hypothetical protein
MVVIPPIKKFCFALFIVLSLFVSWLVFNADGVAVQQVADPNFDARACFKSLLNNASVLVIP